MPRGAAVETVVCLVRHGETDWNREGRLQGREDVELNDRGREQARLTAAFLASQPWDLIVASPLARATETARIIAEGMGIRRVMTMEEFIERDYGEAVGLAAAARETSYADGAWPGLEDGESVSRRCLAGLRTLGQRHSGQRVIVVSHGAAINAILAALSGGEIGTGKTRLGNACLTSIHLRDGAWGIESYNSVSHLGMPTRGEIG